jgi:2-keto-3-deoxy-6-phosphogluconate aldolase
VTAPGDRGDAVAEPLSATRVIAILRLRDHGLAAEVCDALVRGGIRAAIEAAA